MSQLRINSLLQARKSGREPRELVSNKKGGLVSPGNETLIPCKPSAPTIQLSTELIPSTNISSPTTRQTRSTRSSPSENGATSAISSSPAAVVEPTKVTPAKRKSQATNLDTYLITPVSNKKSKKQKETENTQAVENEKEEDILPVPIGSPLDDSMLDVDSAEVTAAAGPGISTDVNPANDVDMDVPPLESVRIPSPEPIQAHPVAMNTPPRRIPRHRMIQAIQYDAGLGNEAPSTNKSKTHSVIASTTSSAHQLNSSHNSLMDQLDLVSGIRPNAAPHSTTPQPPSSKPITSPMRRVAPSTVRNLNGSHEVFMDLMNQVASPRPTPPSAASALAVLGFPTHFTFLLSLFANLDTLLNMLSSRSQSANSFSWNKEIQKNILGLRKMVHLSDLKQLITLYPTAYLVKENPTRNPMGGWIQDYNISFGASNGEGEEIDSKIAAAIGTTGLNLSRKYVNLSGRRIEMEQRMKMWIYNHHQAYLRELLTAHQNQTPFHSTASLSSPSKKSTPPQLTLEEVEEITQLLQTPVNRITSWFHSFRVDSVTVDGTPLPDEQYLKLQNAQSQGPISLKQLSQQKQPIPRSMALDSENRGRPTSTNNGDPLPQTTSAASSSPTASSPSTRPKPLETPSPLSRKSKSTLSVLSPELLSGLIRNIESDQLASLRDHGLPTDREDFTRLTELRKFFILVQGKMGSLKRDRIPVHDLMKQLQGPSLDFGPEKTSQFIDLLVQHLPNWCGFLFTPTKMKIFQVKRIPPGQPQPIQIIDQLIGRQERKLRGLPEEEVDVHEIKLEQAAAALIQPPPSSTASPHTPIKREATGEVKVKLEPAESGASTSFTAAQNYARALNASTNARLSTPTRSPRTGIHAPSPSSRHLAPTRLSFHSPARH